LFTCEDQGELQEDISCKVDYNGVEGYMKIIQPVLIQSFKEPVATPAVPGSVLSKDKIDTTTYQQFKYRSGVDKLIHLSKWFRPEILDVARHMSATGTKHSEASNNWSAGGRLRHVEVRQFFLRDLEEDGLIMVKWIPTDQNRSDIFTKNLYGPAFEEHAAVLVGADKYMQYHGNGVNVGSGEWTLVASTTKKQKKKKKKTTLSTAAKCFESKKTRGEGVGGGPQNGHAVGFVNNPTAMIKPDKPNKASTHNAT
jgi:hypothetical protein